MGNKKLLYYEENIIDSWWTLRESNPLPIRAKDVLYRLTKGPMCVIFGLIIGGVNDGTRTRDSRNHNPVLYQTELQSPNEDNYQIELLVFFCKSN